MPDAMSVAKRNLEKRVDNIKDAGNEEKRALEGFIDDLTDLEVVEGPVKLGANTTKNLAKHFGETYAKNNKDLFDGLERAVTGGDFSLRDKFGGR